MYTVYKIHSPADTSVYFGYNSNPDLLGQFLIGAHRQDAADTDRGEYKFLQLHGSAELSCTKLGQYEDEYDAFVARNDYRAADICSITGPTPLPFAARAEKQSPGSLKQWKKATKIRKAATAKEAYTLGAYTYEAIKKLGQLFGKDTVTNDLNLSPLQFSCKYGV